MAQLSFTMGEPSAEGASLGSAAAPTGTTIGSYFEAFSPAPSWTELGAWPPDVFALTNLVLDHTEAYRFAVAPPAGRRWPPSPDWEARVRQGASAWRDAASNGDVTLPEPLRAEWERLTGCLQVPLAAIRGAESPIWETLLTLHAMADQACQGLATGGAGASSTSFERRAWRLLDRRGTVSRIDPTRVRITPKTHFAGRGITIRSLSRYLALSYESVEVHWRRISPFPAPVAGPRDYNMVLVPWPLQVGSADFRPVPSPLKDMDPAFGFFSFEPVGRLDLEHLHRMLELANERAGVIDAVIFPEAALGVEQLAAVEDRLAAAGAVSLVAGVREPAGAHGFGRNYVHLGICTRTGWLRFQQPKHHRWCLDSSQIRQYHLSRVLDPARSWWEAIELPPRTLEIVDLGNGATTAPLVCEDLARMDEVADLLRRIGPTLVLALLLDGPQLPQRWPCRYATVLADEPGSAVLTLTSLGMASRSRPAATTRSRVVAMWKDPSSELRPIELAKGASGILLRTSTALRTVWTADGRRHESSTPSITLAGVQQLRVPPMGVS